MTIVMKMTDDSTKFSKIQSVAKHQFEQLNENIDQRSTRYQILKLNVLVGELSSSFLMHLPPDPPRGCGGGGGEVINKEVVEEDEPNSIINQEKKRQNKITQDDDDDNESSNNKKPKLSQGDDEIQDIVVADNDTTKKNEEKNGVPFVCPEQCCVLMGNLFFQLAIIAATNDLSLHRCIRQKLQLNERKYPVELCKGKSGKYTKYSDQTGITKTEGQSTNEMILDDDETIDSVMESITKFATERQWVKYHTPRNILLALIGEVGELAELYQWCGDGPSEEETLKKEEFLDKVGQELADVGIYLLRLSYVCNVPNIGNYVLS